MRRSLPCKSVGSGWVVAVQGVPGSVTTYAKARESCSYMTEQKPPICSAAEMRQGGWGLGAGRCLSGKGRHGQAYSWAMGKKKTRFPLKSREKSRKGFKHAFVFQLKMKG